jgi:hypothetical protein
MSVFDATSRYVLFAGLTTATDRKGRVVPCVLPARVPPESNLGIHRRREGQRLDHLANRYMGDPTAFWRIAAHNEAMTVEQIAETDLVPIPVRGV